MRRWLILTAALVLCLAGCGKAEEPVRQLFFPEVAVLKTNVTVPAWFYPATGEMEYLCPHCPHACIDGESACQEEVHGKDCLFYKFSSEKGCSLVGDKLYYFLAEDLYVYDTTTGERERLMDRNTSGLDSYIFKGEYLYRYDDSYKHENGQTYDRMERIYLPDLRVEDIRGQQIPWQIADGNGYYVMADSSPYIVSGLYRQPLYVSGEAVPKKELLLHEVDLESNLLLTKDAVYWTGDNRLRTDPDTVMQNLYRYDLEKQTTVLVAEDFGIGKFVSDGEYLYAVRKREAKYALICTDDYGNITVLGTAAERQRLLVSSVEIVGTYVIADIADTADGVTLTGKMVYDIRTGDVQVCWLQGKFE